MADKDGNIIAKDYGMTVENFNKLLNSMGIQFNQSGLWVLYQKHAEKGYTHTDMYRMVIDLRNMDFIYLVKDMLNMHLGLFFIHNVKHVDGKFIPA